VFGSILTVVGSCHQMSTEVNSCWQRNNKIIKANLQGGKVENSLHVLVYKFAFAHKGLFHLSLKINDLRN
jgi:hypothetical protein